MEQDLFAELLAALDVLVLEPVGDGVFRRTGIAPNWAARFLNGPLATDQFQPATLFPFLEDFLVDSARLWLHGGNSRIESGVWTEVDAAGEEQLLKATALTVSGRPVLVIANADAYAEIRSVIQKARAVSQSMGQDLARQKRVQEQLTLEKDSAESASRTKGRFLANMTHDLRTPLNIVIGYSELLMDDAKSQGRASVVDDLGKIRYAAQHLLSLIGNILDLSKIEAGRVQLHVEPFDVASLVADIAVAIRPLIEKNGNVLQVTAPERLGVSHGDSTKTRQCLLNLLSNAAKFTNRGTITLTAGREAGPNGDRIRFAVSDTGIGLSADQLSRIFEPFVQADASTTMKFGGTGLGLSISRELCRLMGGDIAVQSTPGVGSTFTMDLPAVIGGGENVKT
jgi:signal transduction histidine kinase